MSTIPTSVSPLPVYFTNGHLIKEDNTSRDLWMVARKGSPDFVTTPMFVLAPDASFADKWDDVQTVCKVGQVAHRFAVEALVWHGGANTYHSIRIKLDGTVICPWNGPHYGYGDHYRVTALEWLSKNGWIETTESDRAATWQVLERFGIEIVSAINVNRKADLLC